MVQVQGRSVVKVSDLKLGWSVDIVSFLAVQTPTPTAVPLSDAPTSAPTTPTDAPTKAPTQVGETYAPTDASTKAPTQAGATETPTGIATLSPGSQAASADASADGGATTTVAVLSVLAGLLCVLGVAVVVAIAIAALVFHQRTKRDPGATESRTPLPGSVAQSIQLQAMDPVPADERLPSYEEASAPAIQAPSAAIQAPTGLPIAVAEGSSL